MLSEVVISPIGAVALVLSGAGILVLVVSENALWKRRVFAATLLLGCVAAVALVPAARRSAGVELAVAVVAIAVAVLAYQRVGFCETCGVTMVRPEVGEVRCERCAAMRRTIQ